LGTLGNGFGYAYIGCILGDIKKNIIYSIGVNIYNSDLNNVYKRHTPLSIHAEDNAFHKLKKNNKKQRKNIDIIVFRVNKMGDRLLMSKSCQNCLKKIKKGLVYKYYKLRDFYYTNEKGSLSREIYENEYMNIGV
jgi:hypothetical protein